MFAYLSDLKNSIKDWWQADVQETVDGWSMHHEFMMEEFFTNFNKSGKLKDLVDDLQIRITEIDNLDCPFEKEKQLRNFKIALNTLTGK